MLLGRLVMVISTIERLQDEEHEAELAQDRVSMEEILQ